MSEKEDDETTKESLPSPDETVDKENDNEIFYDTRDDQSRLFTCVESEEVRTAKTIAQDKMIASSTPTTELEKTMSETLKRKQIHIDRLTNEIVKLKTFLSKRKQTYKRKRKDDGAPTRALSAYNIFIKDRFAKLAKDNEKALKSDDTGAQLRRVPPANLVASTGNAWKELTDDDKAKYEERAKEDRKRYEDQMSEYEPPDKASNRKRNKTGYNMFFSAHVIRLKQTETGVPSERGSVARLVGTAWKQLTPDEKQYYEREADKHNGMHPLRDGEDEEDVAKHDQPEHNYYAPADMHMHMAAGTHPVMHHVPHDPRAGYYPPPHMYPQPPYGHFDYSQHHQRHGGRAAGVYQASYHAHPRHAYEG
jgi:hypothetical protein